MAQGYLTATASEDWSLVLEVCDRASANESNAKEAVRALKREFKYVISRCPFPSTTFHDVFFLICEFHPDMLCLGMVSQPLSCLLLE
jgi:hypothetical protein